ncbi:MAG TPA: DUF389 domain-containing protein [Capillimicrobium sp.]|nr:DUF389 domain-containing protein [Capillimicrobium sp.]
MVHLRIVTPAARTDEVVHLLRCADAVGNLVVLRGAAVVPAGDLVLADAAREDASVLIDELRSLGIDECGSISLEDVETAIGVGARSAERAAEGEIADAVLWEQVVERTSEESTLSWTFLAFIVLAACIAVAGILTDSPILIVGAMVVGPEFGPLAGVCVGLVQREPALAGRSLTALAVGFPAAIGAAYVLSEIIFATGIDPPNFSPHQGIAYLIASPDKYSILVAFCAGTAGMLSLSTAKSGALIGVLISVTTIPAAAEVGLAAARSDWDSLGGAAAQLGVNVTTILVAGTLTLALQRLAYHRRRERVQRRLAARGAEQAQTAADQRPAGAPQR